ncbi:hypothetical protein ACIOWK_32820 [Pseudomonas protegens]|uniref:hypothetical protein n=1 Tax=Pseudomonas protegens TaxID=380021 RepID=UPI0037F1DC8F
MNRPYRNLPFVVSVEDGDVVVREAEISTEVLRLSPEQYEVFEALMRLHVADARQVKKEGSNVAS